MHNFPGALDGKSSTRFGLIRHGQTLWNAEKRIQGWRNSPLTATGREMAHAWGKQLTLLPWNRILMSDLGRVQETGQQVNSTLRLSLHNDSRLREQDWGAWSGWSFPDLWHQHRNELVKQEQQGWSFQPPGGESRLEVLARCQEALWSAWQRWPGENILVICHEGIIKCILYALSQRKFLPSEPQLIRGYQLHLVQFGRDGLCLEQANAMELWTV